MRFYLDTEGSAETGTAQLTLGDQKGGDVVATLPYKTELEQKRANMLRYVPQLFEEVAGHRDLWWYAGPAKCPHCSGLIAGASPAQVKRLEELLSAMMPDEQEDDVPVLEPADE